MIHICSLQLRLSEIVEGTQCLFMELADKDDIFSAKVTPQSFHDGLTKKKVSLLYDKRISR